GGAGQLAGGGKTVMRGPALHHAGCARRQPRHEIERVDGDRRYRGTAIVLPDAGALDRAAPALPYHALDRTAGIAAVTDIEERNLDISEPGDLVEIDHIGAGQFLVAEGKGLFAILFLLGDGEGSV